MKLEVIKAGMKAIADKQKEKSKKVAK